MARKKKYESFAEEVIQGTYKNVNTFSTNDYIDENIVKPTLKATKSKTGLKNIDTTKYGKLKIKTDYDSDFTNSVLEGKYDSKNAYYSQDSTDSQVKENKKNKEKEIKDSFEKAKKGQKSEQKLANDNLKTKQKEFDNAINKYQKELSNAYKEEEISFDNRAGLSRENDKISYQTKDKDKTKGTLNTDERVPAIAKVFEKVKKSREKADEKLNELNFAKYQKNVADVNAEETNWYDKTIGNIVRGAADLGSILDIESQKYKTPEGKEVFLPTKNELKQQKVSEDYNTGIGKFLGDVTYNVSKIGTSLTLNTVTGGIGGTATYWTDMYADNYKNAINEGYDKKKAIAYSTIGTAAEYATGKLIGSATKGLTGGKTSQLSSAISNTTNKFLKNPTISNFLGNAGSEATEEFVQEYVDNLNRLVTLEGSKNVDDYIDVFTDKDIFQDALYSAGVGALSGTASNITDGTGRNVKDNTAVIRDFRNQLEQSKSETKDTAKIEKYDKAISLVDDYLKNPFVNNGQINTELANTYNQYQQQQLAPSALETGVQQFVQERATQDVNNRAIQSQVNAFNLGKNAPVNTNTLGNTETIPQGQKTTQIKPSFVESAQKYNIKTDNDTIKSIDRVMSERGVNANFDDTLFKNSNVNALWRTNEDGTREVVFNPNANTNDLLENVAVHELYHDIVQQKGNNFLQDIVLDMASTKDDYINARNELLNEYSKVYDTNNPNFNNMVNEEAVASILGQKLGNQEFINELTTQKRSIAKVIYDNIVSLLNKLNKLTGYKSEKLYWTDVKNKFENAYRSTSTSSKKSDTKYSISSTGELQDNNSGKKVTFNASNVENNKNLLAIHNLNEDKLKGILELGGFPVPSIAITDTSKINHSQFGDISVIFGKNTIDPKNKKNEVYDRDVWSPTFPQVDYNLDTKSIKNVSNKLGIESYDLKDYAENNNTPEFLAERLTRDENVVNKYVEDNNLKYETVYESNGNIDDWKTLKNKKKVALENGLNEYLLDEIKPLFTEKGIYNGKEYITASGNRRSFWQLHDEYNLDNIIKNLTSQKTKGSQKSLATGFGAIQSQMATRFKSIEDIKKNQSKLINLENENEKLTNLRDRLENDIDNLSEKSGLDWEGMEVASELIADFASQKNLDVKTFRTLLDNYYQSFKGVSDEDINKIIQDLNELKDIPTDYFEAKPQRAVGLDEVQAIVIPNNIDEDFKKELKSRFNVIEYDKNIPNDRQSKINSLENLKFSKTNNTWQEFVEKNFKNEGKGTKLQDLKEKPKKTVPLSDVAKELKSGKKTVYSKDIKLTDEDISNVFKVSEEKPTKISNKPKEQTNIKNKALTNQEQQELNALESVPFDLDETEQKRLDYLKSKQQGNIKHIDLVNKTSYDSIKKEYNKYKNQMETFNTKQLMSAEEVISANKQGRRTKNEWLDVAEHIGSNIKTDDSKALEKYAIQSFLYAKPNSKDNLNRQGQKYVKFTIEEWLDRVYKGAGVGEKYSVQGNGRGMEVTAKTSSEDIINRAKKKDGESKFYGNITERSKFLTEENRSKLAQEEDIKYYDKITNKESLDMAMKKLKEGGQNEIDNWFSRNNKETYDSTDVAEGWIMLKRAQDSGDYDMMVNVAKKMREMGTKSGQAIQMYNLLGRLTPEGMVKYATSELDDAWNIASKNKTKKWVNDNKNSFELTPDETKFIVDQMEKISTMEDGYEKNVEIAKVQKMLQDKLPPEKGQGLKAWMRISMLFNPKTQVRNILGNAVITPVNALADVVASRVDKSIAKKTGVRTSGTTSLKNYAKGFKKGLYESYNDFKQGISTRDIQGNRFEVGQGKSFNERHTGALAKQRNAVAKAFNRVDSMLGFLLDVGDRPFYETTFVNSINNQKILNNTNEVTQDMLDIATNEALARTWQDNNEYTKFVLNVRRGMNKLNIKGYGLGDVLIPFAKTPANLTKAIVDYSPVGLVKTLTSDYRKLKNNISTGTVTSTQQHEFAQNLGKAVAGTMLYVAGYALAEAGIITGANDEDKDVSDFMKNTLGIQPYSVKIGDKSFTYDWAQPVAAPFAIMADLKNVDKGTEMLEAVNSVTDTAFNILLEQSFLTGIQDVLGSYGSKVEGIENQIFGLPARAVPTFVKQINDLIDPYSRMVYEQDKQLESAKNQVKTKTPGVSKELPVTRDTLGRKVEKYGGDNNIFNVFFNPANTNKGKASESAKEIYKVYEATKDKDIMPRYPSSTLKLNNKQKSQFLKISGTIIEDNVKELKNNTYYKMLDDEDKAATIKGIVDYAYNKAKSEVTGSEISNLYKTADKKVNSGVSLYDYYAKKTYNSR